MRKVLLALAVLPFIATCTGEAETVSIRIIDADGQIPGDVVTECRHHGVVVRPTPLAEDVGEPEDDHFGPTVFSVSLQHSFSVAFALAVGVLRIGLNR